MWIYFIAQHGPGHQSTTDGFLELADGSTKETIEDEIRDRLRDRFVENDVTRWWKVAQPSRAYIIRSIRSLSSAIKDAKAQLTRLSKMKPEIVDEVGEDKTISKALVGVIGPSLLEKLHKKDIVIPNSSIGEWRRGNRKPVAKIRRKVMNAIKAADKYPK